MLFMDNPYVNHKRIMCALPFEVDRLYPVYFEWEGAKIVHSSKEFDIAIFEEYGEKYCYVCLNHAGCPDYDYIILEDEGVCWRLDWDAQMIIRAWVADSENPEKTQAMKNMMREHRIKWANWKESTIVGKENILKEVYGG